jgi:hypothetical protein
MRHVVLLTVLLATMVVGGCKVALQPSNIQHVPASDVDQKAPAALQDMTVHPPRAFLVKSEEDWKRLWGSAQAPKVNFQKNMVFVAFDSINSGGPGTMEIWVLKYLEEDAQMLVRVKESLSGEWTIGAGYSRAYDVVALPRTDKPVKVQWEYEWGTRKETRELDAEEWAPAQ